MADFEYESNSDSEWDDSWDTLWSEHDWEAYLANESDEVQRYQRLYNKLAQHPNRLDEIALRMGWDLQVDPKDSDSSEPPQDALPELPYTLHKHPLFIASKALHGWMTEKWSQRVALCTDRVKPIFALEVQNTITQSDQYGLLGVTALDLGDYTLAVAYFKRGLQQLNKLLAQLNGIEAKNAAPLEAYGVHAKIRIFDLREIWLRVMSDCRDAASGRFEEE